MWISGVEHPDWGVVFARTGAKGSRGGITAFIVDPKRQVSSLRKIRVMRSYQPYEVHLEDYEIPVENRLGEEGAGFRLAEKWLVHARVPYAAASIGVAQASLALAIEWAKQRETFGSQLADKQAIQWMIADSEIELRAARLLVYQAAWNGDRGQDIKVDASIAKVYATETAGRVVDRCIQIFGGMGVAQEMPLERWYRELRIKRIGEGPSEVQRMVIARDLLSAASEEIVMSIDVSVEDGIGLITINRPERLNAMDAEHYQGLSRGLDPGARRSGHSRRHHHRRRRARVHSRRRHQELPHEADRALRDVADAARPAAQSRARSVEADHRRGQRLLPRRRHDAAVRDRHPRRRAACDVQPRRGEARPRSRQRRHPAYAEPASLRDRHGDAADRRYHRRGEGRALGSRQQGGAVRPS